MNQAVSEKEAAHSTAVKEMFAGIAPRYDLLNHVLSLNIDKRWRNLVARELRDILNREDATVLDVACGTGDLALELARDTKAQIIGTDFCRPMLDVAHKKTTTTNTRVPFVEADAMTLPVGDASFDAATIAFGLRNLPNYENGLKELCRVLKPNGKLVVLECSHPRLPVFRQLYEFYFSTILPRIGGLVSGSRAAYTYLPESVSKFPEQDALADLMKNCGFSDVRFQNLTGGIAAIHVGVKS